MLHSIRKPAGQANGLDEEAIVDRIFEAVIDQRLPPGTKLSEAALCEAFGVGRMRVRRSLLLLASRSIVDLHSNRGAYVSRPTPEQAREVFETRLAIEPNVARIVAERADMADIDEIMKHLTRESAAQQEGNRRNAIRLSGQFHVKLAELARNHVMERMVKELVTRTSLIIGMFGAPGTSNCHDDEHLQILSALRDRDQDSAALLMERHLAHITHQIDLTAEPRRNVDLVELFRAE